MRTMQTPANENINHIKGFSLNNHSEPLTLIKETEQFPAPGLWWCVKSICSQTDAVPWEECSNNNVYKSHQSPARARLILRLISNGIRPRGLLAQSLHITDFSRCMKERPPLKISLRNLCGDLKMLAVSGCFGPVRISPF